MIPAILGISNDALAGLVLILAVIALLLFIFGRR